MAMRKPARGRRTPAQRRTAKARVAPAKELRRARRLIVRVAAPVARVLETEARAAEPDVPEAAIRAAHGAVTLEIAFGHAQHGKYTIQLFDPSGTIELSRETGLSTDATPDRFDLKLTAAQLDGHLLQWSGAVDAFSNAPGQRFAVIFDVSQRGSSVPGGHVEKTGPLEVTQAFLGVLRLVTS
jgi:hypothetical protein